MNIQRYGVFKEKKIRFLEDSYSLYKAENPDTYVLGFS